MAAPLILFLEKDLVRLRKRLLPNKFNALGAYSDLWQMRGLSYRMLCHATVEQFLEEWSTYLMHKGINVWAATSRLNAVASSLVFYSERQGVGAPTRLCPTPGSEEYRRWMNKYDFSTALDKAKIFHSRRIHSNHGIKEENLLQLFMPVGIRLSDFDPLWIAEMNSFGATRGSAAHTAASKLVATTAINVEEEYERVVNKVLPGLVIFNTLLSAFDSSLV